MLNAAERLAGSYGSECASLRQDLAIAESRLRDYQARLGKPFPLDTYSPELTLLRDRPKSGLSGTPPEAGTDPRPTVADLTGR